MRSDTFALYLREIESKLRRPSATEHTHRTALKRLVEASAPGVTATNEPKREECGAPDFIVESAAAPLGYIEAKDVGTDLDAALSTEQLSRYLKGLPNLILTNYLEFRWFAAGKLRLTATAGVLSREGIIEASDLAATGELLASFLDPPIATVRSPKELAQRMAAIAQLIRATLEDALRSAAKGDPLTQQLEGFSAPQFADMYAQTLCYGLFAARCSPNARLVRFTRENAALGLLAADPLLRRLFGHLAGPDLDGRIAWAVDALIELLNRVDLALLLRGFGKRDRREDPAVHFYEAFLSEYDPHTRAVRGVYYTPEPIVQHIVRSVDYVLKSRFGLPQGLADASTSLDRSRRAPAAGAAESERTLHKVLVLDPAAGTGTFLSAVIRLIHARVAAGGDSGAWSDYVSNHLLPRVFGFELLMAPYAVAHMKLGLQLIDTGHDFRSPDRIRVLLTNALEGPHELAELPPFSGWPAEDADAAGERDRDPSIMVVLGNPPYSIFGQTPPGPWIRGLLDDYKTGLNERKLNLDDAFIKFIRLGQWHIERRGAGVLAFVVSNTFLDGITHRRMRESLLDFFTEIFVLDLHGSSKKNERTPGDEKDENVFDIQQGVAIVIMIKARRSRPAPSKVWHADLWGSRAAKYLRLESEDLSAMTWRQIEPEARHFFFVPKDLDLSDEYSAYPSLHGGVFLNKNTGIQTKRDRLVYHINKEELDAVLHDITDLSAANFAQSYGLPGDGRDWTLAGATADVRTGKGRGQQVLYHPFDLRWTWYSGRTKGWMAYPRSPLMQSALKPNLLLLTVRNARRGNVDSFLVAATLVDKDAVSPFDNVTFFPLYIYGVEDGAPAHDDAGTALNMSPEFISSFSRVLEAVPDAVRAERLVHYIYAVLYAPSYRARYAELLRIDYPRIPRTTDPELFAALAERGRILVELHLMRQAAPPMSTFSGAGDRSVEQCRYESGRVYVNSTQHFDGVPAEAWGFRIGGYPVLEKWLKERRGRTLSSDEVQHFHAVVSVLSKTCGIMREIDQVILDFGGWPLADT